MRTGCGAPRRTLTTPSCWTSCFLVLTGSPGTASVIAQAIDESTLHDQEGTLAGDNTLLVLFADEVRLERWLARFRAIESLAVPTTPAVPAPETLEVR